ncbi:S8 family serine peptidase [Tissierella carlieri]|uniref:S8 family serine peptidase n=1 Tax=Tissierella carlieri TaxID=689904 RepID=A0ABT1S4U0_9FIRM|nr:S8 family serine peptidase [Tissierella carlieri]MCQ4921489.1 S8 family serine peptidase [Tissierella carlieri]
MKKILSLLMVLTLIVSMSITAVAEEENIFRLRSDEIQTISGELIVSVENGSDYSLQNTGDIIAKHVSIFKDKDFVIKDSLISSIDNDKIKLNDLDEGFIEQIVKDMGYVYLVSYSKEYRSQEDAIKELEKTLEESGVKVRYIEPNYMVYASGEYILDDYAIEIDGDILEEEIGLQMHNNQRWHYEMIKAPSAWNITSGSIGVKIAVLDTGIDHNHQSLRDFVDRNLGRNFSGGSSTDTMDRQGHGTHVAGTIASYGSVSGVMKNATLIPVKVLGDDGRGSTYGIVQGVLHAANIQADVINMSLGGGGYLQSFDDACRTAVSRGVVVVAASGNEYASSISYPAAYDSVIAVGAVDSNRRRASFSNYGTGLELMAPGVNIYSTIPGNQYQTNSGTSMASPHVAGVAGLMRSVNRNASVSEIRSVLRNTAQYAGNSTEYGYGIVDAYAAVQAISGNPAPNTETRTSVMTDKTSYYRSEIVNVTVKVTNKDGQPLQGATTKLTLTSPDNSKVSAAKTTNASGEVQFTITANANSLIGNYGILIETSLTGYSPSTANTTFRYIN